MPMWQFDTSDFVGYYIYSSILLWMFNTEKCNILTKNDKASNGQKKGQDNARMSRCLTLERLINQIRVIH